MRFYHRGGQLLLCLKRQPRLGPAPERIPGMIAQAIPDVTHMRGDRVQTVAQLQQ